MKTKTQPTAEKFAPPPEEANLTFEEALQLIARVPKEVVDKAMKQAKKKRQRQKKR
jgi:hypothetical protein